MPFWKKQEQAASAVDDLKAIEASVSLARSRLADQKRPLAELFAMLGEDDRDAMNALSEARRKQAQIDAALADDKPAKKGTRA